MPKKALKYDEGKADLSQVTLELVEGLARVRMFGEKKYARDNWKKGFKVTRSLSACLRHVFKFLSGETYDQESGLCHLFHAVACLEHAIWDMAHRAEENDDRYRPTLCSSHLVQSGAKLTTLDGENCEECKPL